MSTTITGLPNATTPLSGTERVPMDQAGATKDATTQDIANLAPGTDLTFTQSTRVLASSTGADVTLPVATDALPGLMAAADKAKLDGVAAGATANSSDATLLNRANHTGTQSAGTITGLATVATSGSYADLSNKPSLGTAAAANTGTASGNVVVLDGSARLPAVDGSQLTGINATTDLDYTASTRVLTSSTGADVTLPLASGTDPGLMAAADKTKLDGIAAGAEVNVNPDWNASSGDAQILNKPTIPSLSDATPQAPGTAAAGTASSAARGDHVHALPPVVSSSTAGLVPATGGGTTNFLRADGTFAAPPGGTPGGSSGQLQWNSAGSFAGVTGSSIDGSGNITLGTRFISSLNGAASAPPGAFTGTWFTGGTATTTKPHVLIEPTGTTSTAWSTSGTGLGVNAQSGFVGNLLDLQVNGTRYASINGTTDAFVGPNINFGIGNIVTGLGAVAFGRGGTSSGRSSFCYSTGSDGPTSVSGEGAIGMGRSNTASGDYSVVLGINQIASGNQSTSIGGRFNTASGAQSCVFGGLYGRADKAGQFAHGIDRFAADGDAQWSILGFRGSTTDATVTEIFLNGVANTRATLPASTTWMADINVVARSSGGTNNACFKRRCIIKRDASNNTALVGSVLTVDTDIGSNSGAPPAGWDVTVSANDTNEALKIEVTGAAATNIRWVAQVDLVEVGFA